jgi:hypothetical protein
MKNTFVHYVGKNSIWDLLNIYNQGGIVATPHISINPSAGLGFTKNGVP